MNNIIERATNIIAQFIEEDDTTSTFNIIKLTDIVKAILDSWINGSSLKPTYIYTYAVTKSGEETTFDIDSMIGGIEFSISKDTETDIYILTIPRDTGYQHYGELEENDIVEFSLTQRNFI